MTLLAISTSMLAPNAGSWHADLALCMGGTAVASFAEPTQATPMGELFKTIRRLAAEARYVVGHHASERLEKRGIMEWQVVAGLDDGRLIVERPNAVPNPVVAVREQLPDGTEFKAVWSYVRANSVAKLVTIHFFDGGRS